MITALQGMPLACGAEALQKIPWSVKPIDPGGILERFYLKKWGAETARYPHPSSWDG
jgi:hypothetical protein